MNPRALGKNLLAAGALSCAFCAASARADTLAVGPGQPYSAPCAAIAAAHDNDVIEIDATGDYGGDVCEISKNGLTLRGKGGRAKLEAQGKSAGGKAIWVISGNDTTVEDLEFSGATVADQNGAGIRQEGDDLTVRRCYFHDNDDGILSDASAQSQIVIEYSEFGHNGFGDGYSHNLYIGNVARFTLRYSYSHDAKVGHLLKSRAAQNYILYNRLSGELGTSSYELDLPNAGTSVVLGNLIEQGPNTENPSLLAYGEEGTTPANPGHDLHVVNNTFVNDRPNGGTFLNIGSAIDEPVQVQNDIFTGPGQLVTQASAVQSSNYSGADPLFLARQSYDYALRAGSPCIDQGSDPGTLGAFSLAPIAQYLHPTSSRPRAALGTLDIGAYEFDPGSEAGASGAASATDGLAGSAGSPSTPSAAAGTIGEAGADEPSAAGKSSSGCSCRAARSSESAGNFSWIGLLAGLSRWRIGRRIRARFERD